MTTNTVQTNARTRGALDCGHLLPLGYSEHTADAARTKDGKFICYECCAMADLGRMLHDGHSRRLPLYWNGQEVTNWPGTLRFKPYQVRAGRHNIAGCRTDVWFAGHDNHVWHGVCIGSNTQVVHCVRTMHRRAFQEPPRKNPYSLKDAGCYVDGCRGVYMIDNIFAFAKNHGFTTRLPIQYVANDVSLAEYEFSNEVEDEIDSFMNDKYPVGNASWGRNDNGDWGLWEIELEAA